MGHVVILRGISGAGKSTYRENTYPNAPFVSADDFFIRQSGEYVFDGTKKGEAHNWCMGEFLQLAMAMKVEKNAPQVLVVDNTNLHVAEIAPYYATAQGLGHTAEIITIWENQEKAHLRNVHETPDWVVSKQFHTLLMEGGRFPPWWVHWVWCEDLSPQTMYSMGSHYSRMLSMLRLAKIPFSSDKTQRWIEVGRDAGKVMFLFDEEGHLTNDGWVPPTQTDEAS